MLGCNEVAIYKEILDNSRKRFLINFWDDNGKEKAKKIFKYLFEDILKWDVEKIVTHFNYEMVCQYKLTSPYKKYYNGAIGNIVNDIYPDYLKGKRIPFTDKTKIKISIAQKNLSIEKRESITKGARENRYTKEYAKKLSDTKLGEINPQHKLKTEQVIEIKKLWATGIYTTTYLGEKFKISRQSIADIVYGRTWKHLK